MNRNWTGILVTEEFGTSRTSAIGISPTTNEKSVSGLTFGLDLDKKREGKKEVVNEGKETVVDGTETRATAVVTLHNLIRTFLTPLGIWF